MVRLALATMSSTCAPFQSHLSTLCLAGSPACDKKLRLRDLADVPFVWFPRRAGPAFYDRLMQGCYRGGLKASRIIQEGLNEATILSLVATGFGVGWVLGSARWRCPKSAAILPVVDSEHPPDA
jgi:DNA-binding transcriptional LysR family regulator